MSFNINKKLIFIVNLQLLSSSSDSSVKNLVEDHCKYLGQEFGSKAWDLINHRGFYPYEYLSGFEKFKEILSSKAQFYGSLIRKKISDKEYEYFLKVWGRFEINAKKYYHNLLLICDVLLLADVCEKFRNSSLKIMGYAWVIIWELQL